MGRSVPFPDSLFRGMEHDLEVTWAELKIPDAEFDIVALHAVINARRIDLGMSWKTVAREVNRSDERYDVHPISSSTISGLKNKRGGVEGDGVLQMLLWLDRSPESFVPGHPGGVHPDALLPRISGQVILRFDVPLIYSKLEAQRTARGLTWTEVAGEIGGICRADQLENMRMHQRTGFPHVMRLARW